LNSFCFFGRAEFLSLEYPYLYANLPGGAKCLSKSIINDCSQGVQRDSSFLFLFSPRHFGAANPT
jgi:hypothetical protein